MKVAVGIEIGGTKVAVALINENGEIVSRSQSPSQTASAESLYQGVVQLIMIYAFKIRMGLVLDYQGR